MDAELVATNENGEPLATAKQGRKFHAMAKPFISDEQRPAWLLEQTGGRISSWTQVTEAEADDLIAIVQDMARNQTPGAF